MAILRAFPTRRYQVRKLVPILAVSILALAVPACSSGGGSADDCVDLSGQGDTFTIHIKGFEFDPSCFTASASQSISVVNEDGAVHSFTLQGTPIDVDVPAQDTFNGESVSGVVDPGTYDLICKYHPEMKGTVTVVT
jgi:plastocyanin